MTNLSSLKTTVSVGIPAFNEGYNIKRLLNLLLAQTATNFILKEIIVISDASSDNTDAEVKSIKDKKILLFRNPSRMGLAYGQNKIVKLFKGEILVILNADTIFYDTHFIETLIEPFKRNEKIAIVSPAVRPLKAITRFESMINFSVECRESMFREWQNGNNVFHCQGLARAFSKDFAKSLKWPTGVGEDAFAYFVCLKNKLEFKYQSKTTIYYRSPANFADHKKQSYRFLNSRKIMLAHFNKDLVLNAYNLPFRLKAGSTIRYFFKNPINWTIYGLIFFFIYLTSNKNNYSNFLWDVSKSSKVLNYHAT